MTYVSKSAKELERHWPNVSGLTAKTEKQEGREPNLLPETGSTVSRRYKVGI